MNILICTICRNEGKFLQKWYDQIKKFVTECKDINFSLSVLENDSTDDTAKMLQGFDFSFIKHRAISNKTFELPFFIGGKHPARLQILAISRNECIRQFTFLDHITHILLVEPDVTYSLDTIKKILYHEREYGIKMDIFTGKSVHPGGNSLYDSFGSRYVSTEYDWDEKRPTDNGFEPMWSTFNCLALYNAEPIKRGITFGHINPRTGLADCDCSVICENFRQNGFNNIYWDSHLLVTHYCN